MSGVHPPLAEAQLAEEEWRAEPVPTLRELCLRKVARSAELLSSQPRCARWLQALPPGELDEIVSLLVAQGRWEDLPFHALSLLISGAPRELDLAAEGIAIDDVAFRACASSDRSVGLALRVLRASQWITDATVFAVLQSTCVAALSLRACSLVRLSPFPALLCRTAPEPLSETLLELDISHSAVTDTAMRRLLPRLPSLRTLRASGSRLTPRAFGPAGSSSAGELRPAAIAAPPPALPQLRELDLSACAGFVLESALLARRFPLLELLDLSAALAPAPQPAATAPSLAEALRRWAPTLAVLRLGGLPHSLEPSAFREAGELPQLRELDLRGCPRADALLSELQAPALASLAVGCEATQVGERAVRALRARSSAPGLRSLRALRLECAAADALASLAEGLSPCPEAQAQTGLPCGLGPGGAQSSLLRALSLSDCAALTDELCAALHAACPGLLSLELRRDRPHPAHRDATLDADGEGARRLLARLTRLVLHHPASSAGRGLSLSLPVLERLELRMAPGSQLRAISAPLCVAFALSALDSLAPPPPPPPLPAPAPKRARGLPGSACDGSALLRLPRLERLSLARCEPSATAELLLAALASASALQELCVSECALSEQQLTALGAPLQGAAVRSMRACRLSACHLPLQSSALRALSRLGGLVDVLRVSRRRGECTCNMHSAESRRDLTS